MECVSFPQDFVANFHYVHHNIHESTPESPYKCGPKCSCQMQKRLAVFKTETRGWGVRAAENIPQDTFICEYVGEVMEFSNLACHDYQFQMARDDRFPDSVVVVDALRYGNVARFINHRCDGGNVRVQHEPYERLDGDERSMSHIMMYASRDIKVGEELCFDYSGGDGRYIFNEICRCGSTTCCMAWEDFTGLDFEQSDFSSKFNSRL